MKMFRVVVNGSEYKVGIEAGYFKLTLEKAGLNPEVFGKALFRNFEGKQFLPLLHQGL